MEFTKGLQALHDEYINYRNKKGEIITKPKLSIYKVEEGSIIFDLIEAFDPKARKLIFADKSIKQEFAEGEENIFTHIYYVDVTVMYNEGKIVAYRIDKVHDKFLPEDQIKGVF